MPKRDPNFSLWAISEEGVRSLVLPAKIKSRFLDNKLVEAAESAWNAARKLYSKGEPPAAEEIEPEERKETE